MKAIFRFHQLKRQTSKLQAKSSEKLAKLMKSEAVFVSLIGKFHDLYDGMMWLEGVDVFFSSFRISKFAHLIRISSEKKQKSCVFFQAIFFSYQPLESDNCLDSKKNLGGGFIHICYFHPDPWGRWTHFDEHMFQRGGLKPPTRKVSKSLHQIHGSGQTRNDLPTRRLVTFNGGDSKGIPPKIPETFRFRN